jgi:hypothetical protein
MAAVIAATSTRVTTAPMIHGRRFFRGYCTGGGNWPG